MLKQHELGEVFMHMQEWINKNVGIGLLLSVALCIMCAALGALLLDKEVLELGSAGTWGAASWFLVSFVGCRAARRDEKAGLLHAAVQALLLYLLVWCAALGFGTASSFRENGWVITACIWGGALAAGVLPKEKKKRKGKRRGRTSGQRSVFGK